MNSSTKQNLLVWVRVLSMLLVLGCGSTQKTINNSQSVGSPNDIHWWRQQLKARQDKAPIYFKIGVLYASQQRPEEALAAVDSALLLNHHFNSARILRAKLYLQNHRLKEAYSDYLEVLRSDDGDEYVELIRNELGQPYPIYPLTKGDYHNAFPSFCPDNRRIAFQSDRDGNWEIYLMDIESGQTVRLTNHPEQDEMPVFGTKQNVLAFCSTRDDSIHKGRLDKTRNIYLMNLITGDIARIIDSPADDWYPALVGDGDKLIFVSERDDSRSVPFHEKLSEIYLCNISDGSLVRLTQNECDDTAPSVSANGKWILFSSDRSGNFQLYRMDLRGNMVQPVETKFPQGNCGAPRYSSDGKMITFFVELETNADIYMMDQAGTSVTRLTNDPAVDSYPSFSPDKRKIIFHSNRTGKYQIYWIDLMNPFTQDELIAMITDKISQLE
ncbi:MAG: hypothetical protein ONB31_12870 [candidate division KSB1 bacterium]|nr:hypothetical protein [candidate division KSB1 bacterium]MDZ7400511.1 hypothetical protein [candidate division KSB1 bacterium]